MSLLYLGKFVPQLIEISKDFCMNLRATDAIDISQNTQNSPPKDEGGVRMPASQCPARNDADIVSQTLTAVYRVRNRVLVWATEYNY